MKTFSGRRPGPTVTISACCSGGDIDKFVLRAEVKFVLNVARVICFRILDRPGCADTGLSSRIRRRFRGWPIAGLAERRSCRSAEVAFGANEDHPSTAPTRGAAAVKDGLPGTQDVPQPAGLDRGEAAECVEGVVDVRLTPGTGIRTRWAHDVPPSVRVCSLSQAADHRLSPLTAGGKQ
jgi:hypothetical protein